MKALFKWFGDAFAHAIGAVDVEEKTPCSTSDEHAALSGCPAQARPGLLMPCIDGWLNIFCSVIKGALALWK